MIVFQDDPDAILLAIVDEAVASGSGAGQRPSLADYIMVTGGRDGATAAGGRSC